MRKFNFVYFYKLTNLYQQLELYRYPYGVRRYHVGYALEDFLAGLGFSINPQNGSGRPGFAINPQVKLYINRMLFIWFRISAVFPSAL